MYRIVSATASTPFRMALVPRWCSTTCDGTGSTLPSSARPAASTSFVYISFVVKFATPAVLLLLVPFPPPLVPALKFVPLAVTTGSCPPTTLPTPDVAPPPDLLLLLTPPPGPALEPPTPAPARADPVPEGIFWFMISFSRCRGSDGACGCCGGWLCACCPCVSHDSSSSAAHSSCHGVRSVHAASSFAFACASAKKLAPTAVEIAGGRWLFGFSFVGVGCASAAADADGGVFPESGTAT